MDRNGGDINHDNYTSLVPFVLPTIAIINLLANDFDDVSMVGISGGGWTATIAAAIDPRIKFSCPVAGSLPQAYKPVAADYEQGALFGVSDYPDIYALGAFESGRHQRQVLIRDEPSTLFGSVLYGTNYEAEVVDVVDALVAGTFDWYEDTSQAIHAISSKALYDAIAPLLGITINVLFEQYIKVGESGYSKTGNWNFFSQTADGVEVAASPFNGVATWEFTGLASGVYDIFASWSEDANRQRQRHTPSLTTTRKLLRSSQSRSCARSIYLAHGQLWTA